MSAKEKQDLVVSALVAARDLPAEEVDSNILPWAGSFADGEYDENFRMAMADYSGANEIPVSKDGYQRLKTLEDLRIAYTSPVAKEYSAHLSANIDTQIAKKQSKDPEIYADWIRNDELSDVFQKIVRITVWSEDNQSLGELQDAYAKSIQRKTLLLNEKDRDLIESAMEEAEAASE